MKQAPNIQKDLVKMTIIKYFVENNKDAWMQSTNVKIHKFYNEICEHYLTVLTNLGIKSI